MNVEGLTIPGIEKPIKINLFADDTTIYLSKHDRMDSVEEILESWCKVSGAKFNLEKTEIIPMGTEQHRSTIIRTRKINQADETSLDPQIHIAKDGEAVRSLGAWIGNKAEDLTQWETVLDTVKKKLVRWNKTHPTLFGKKLIVQAIVGGHTQFLAKAQGMPPHIEDVLMKLIRDFIWDYDVHPRIALEYLYRPLNEGGLNLLDIKARNEAIDIMWLKAYLDLSPSRPTWATITDILINAAAPPGTSPLATINTFTQSWHPPTRGLRASRLGKDITKMLKTAKKYKTNLAAIRLSPEIRKMLPAWYHPAAVQRPLTNITSKCLLKKHSVRTIADLVKRTNKLREQRRNREHAPSPTCTCQDCIQERLDGCHNPNDCAHEALTRIQDLAPKYNPLAPDIHDDLSLTPNRKAKNVATRRNDTETIFDPSITCKESLAECFRIFTNPEKISLTPASRHLTRGLNLDNIKMKVYTDGACMKNGKSDAKCGSGIWIAPDHHLNKAIKVPGPSQSNQVGELAAVIVAAEIIPNYCKLTIATDSRYVIDGLTHHLQEWEDRGWIGIKNVDLFKRAAYLLKRRTAPTLFKWVKGHNGNLGNEESDKLAKEEANKDAHDIITLQIPKDFDLQGAKLATITQAIAYRGILEQQAKLSRPSTTQNLELTREALKAFQNTSETDETLWQNLRKRTIRTRVQQFLYKAMHKTPMIGEIWFNIPGYGERGICGICNLTESMSHILTTCEADPVKQIWDLAKNMWPHNPSQWPEINVGIILGCGSITTKKDDQGNDKRCRQPGNKGTVRLTQILISEAAHLIWVLRCERVIQNKTHTAQETKSRWIKAINRRLTDDKITATKIKRNEPFTRLVEATWDKLLRKSSDPPRNWILNREVLVGSSA